MRIAKVIALVGLIAMSVVLVSGFTRGNFGLDGAELLQNPWGIVSLVDLYVGFALFSMWIVFREQKVLPATIWVILMMTLGFWAGALYTFIALQTSQNNWDVFWYGRRAHSRINKSL